MLACSWTGACHVGLQSIFLHEQAGRHKQAVAQTLMDKRKEKQDKEHDARELQNTLKAIETVSAVQW